MELVACQCSNKRVHRLAFASNGTLGKESAGICATTFALVPRCCRLEWSGSGRVCVACVARYRAPSSEKQRILWALIIPKLRFCPSSL
ncbi:hypothetical protein J6590_054735 [Homalodisca vitripennis]|nr:hypothetical protein J6590_054735 [Homalodisca vitripennis]